MELSMTGLDLIAFTVLTVSLTIIITLAVTLAIIDDKTEAASEPEPETATEDEWAAHILKITGDHRQELQQQTLIGWDAGYVVCLEQVRAVLNFPPANDAWFTTNMLIRMRNARELFAEAGPVPNDASSLEVKQ